MGRFIVKINDLYFVWSTVVDAPIWSGFDWENLLAWERDEYPDRPSNIAHRQEELDRECVLSDDPFYTKAELLEGNRAGPDESELTEDEIYQAYGLQERVRDGWSAFYGLKPDPT